MKVIHSVRKYFQLFGLFVRHGKLQHSGENFNEKRAAGLHNLMEFVPPGRNVGPGGGTTKSLVAQAAFFKSSLKTNGGHLISGTLAYIRVPKSASTSMSKAMLENKYPALRQKTVTEKQINYLTDVNLETGVIQQVSYFTIVRNPFSRLVSVYRDFFEGNYTEFVFRDYLFGVLPKSISFSEFVDRIGAIPDRLQEPHVKPQYFFLKYYEQKKMAVSIFKLEEPEKINQFLHPHGLQLPHLNKSNLPYDYREYYTLPILKKVSVLYTKDIEKFDYQKEHQELVDFLNTKS